MQKQETGDRRTVFVSMVANVLCWSGGTDVGVIFF